jgi:hypothetical protein
MLLFGLLVRLAGKKFNLLSIGIDGRCWRPLVKLIASKTTIRDEGEYADLSLLINMPTDIEKPDHPILGINLTPWHSTYEEDNCWDIMTTLRTSLEAMGFLKTHSDWEVKFFSFNKNEKYSDEIINLNAYNIVKTLHERTSLQSYTNVRNMLREVGKCSEFWGQRYHSLVFAYMNQIPFKAIEPIYPSTTRFFNRFRSIPLSEAKKMAERSITA